MSEQIEVLSSERDVNCIVTLQSKAVQKAGQAVVHHLLMYSVVRGMRLKHA